MAHTADYMHKHTNIEHTIQISDQKKNAKTKHTYHCALCIWFGSAQTFTVCHFQMRTNSIFATQPSMFTKYRILHDVARIFY